jgi:hypothetical protein
MKIIFLLLAFFAGAHTFADNPFPPQPPPGPPAVAFDTLQEGSYAIQLVCAAAASQCNSALIHETDRMIVTNLGGRYGLSVSFSSSDAIYGDFVGSLLELIPGPTPDQFASMGGFSEESQRFSYMDATIDAKTGNVSGTLIDNVSAGNYLIKGHAISRIADIVTGVAASTLGMDAFLGEYRGSVGSTTGTLIIKQTPAKQIIGSFASDRQMEGQPVFALNFVMGRWNPDIGVLQMITENPRWESFGELDLALQVPPTNKIFKGFYATLFVDYAAKFTPEPAKIVKSKA